MGTNPKQLLVAALLSWAAITACVCFLHPHRITRSPKPLTNSSTVSPVALDQPHQITERINKPTGYLALDVLVLGSTDAKSLRHYATSIAAAEKHKGRVVIWFFNGNTDLGSYDSKNNSLKLPSPKTAPV